MEEYIFTLCVSQQWDHPIFNQDRMFIYDELWSLSLRLYVEVFNMDEQIIDPLW